MPPRRLPASLCRLLSAAVFSGLLTATAVSADLPPTVDPSQPTLLEQAFTLDEGTSVPRDAAAAAALYQQAAAGGDAYAHLRLGYLAETGDGVPQDYTAARQHYQAAADAGLKEGHLHLAICHLEGWGAPADRAAFVRELRTAAEAGSTTAQRILSEITMIGFAVPKDPTVALQWLEKAALAGDPVAQVAIGNDVESTRMLALMPDRNLARTWFERAAAQEHLAAMRAMALSFLAGSRQERNTELARRWLELAASDGDPTAPLMLAQIEVLHVDSAGIDEASALDLIRTSARRGNQSATEVLELMNTGLSVRQAFHYQLTTPEPDRYLARAARKAAQADPKRPGFHPPEIVKMVKPSFPASLRFLHVTGHATVRFTVDRDGQVVDAKVTESTHPLFSESALTAIRQWHFHPATRDGRPVTDEVILPLTFSPTDENIIEGVDAMLRLARQSAAKQSPEVQADATDLRIAHLASPPPPSLQVLRGRAEKLTRAYVILAIDETGTPQRAHLLFADQPEVGASVLAAALTCRYEPASVDGKPIPSHVLLAYPYVPWGDRPIEID